MARLARPEPKVASVIRRCLARDPLSRPTPKLLFRILTRLQKKSKGKSKKKTSKKKKKKKKKNPRKQKKGAFPK